MHKITFYPIGNADCCKIDLNNGKSMLFDYADVASDDADDKRIDLAYTIGNELKQENKDEFDVVGFTHADKDHIQGSSDFFYLDHAKKYQTDGRIKIKELWVPAAMIVEENLEDDARILRQEARYRLLNGYGIKVFSNPECLSKWLEENNLTLEDRKQFIIGAGTIVPGYSKKDDEIEFFVHSPFAVAAEGGIESRNAASLILQATFLYNKIETKFLIIGDTEAETLSEIVNVTKSHNNEDKLAWDIYDIPHHCSYLALSQDKGNDKTEPLDEIKWLLQQGKKGGLMISSSKVIPSNDEDSQPPHRQAAKCYQEYAENLYGEFRVTMEFPTKKNPAKMVIKINESGATIIKAVTTGVNIITTQFSPRAGSC